MMERVFFGLTSLYNRDTASLLGVRMVPKLKLEHISLTSFSKMRVDLAAQVKLLLVLQSCNCITLYVPASGP